MTAPNLSIGVLVVTAIFLYTASIWLLESATQYEEQHWEDIAAEMQATTEARLPRLTPQQHEWHADRRREVVEYLKAERIAEEAGLPRPAFPESPPYPEGSDDVQSGSDGTPRRD